MTWPTLTDVKNYLGVTDASNDSYLTVQINGAIDSIERYCGRNFEAADLVESHVNPDYSSTDNRNISLIINQPPINSITSVKDGDGTDLEYLSIGSGMLNGKFNTVQTVVVTYNGGYTTIPGDVISVFYDMVRARYGLKSAPDESLASNIKSRSIPGVMTETFFGSSAMGNSTNAERMATNAEQYAEVLNKYTMLSAYG